MSIQERIEALETEFAEKIKALKAEVQQEQEFPKEGDEYWYADHDGGVLPSTYDNHYMDRDRQLIGNIFRTEQEAHFAVEKLKVEAELRKFSQRPNIGAVKWFIACDDSGNVYTSYTNQGIFQGSIYFESAEKIRQALESVGEDRIKKYIFGVEG